MWWIPEPAWKTNPDIVADESFRARYLLDDDEEDEEEQEDDEQRND